MASPAEERWIPSRPARLALGLGTTLVLLVLLYRLRHLLPPFVAAALTAYLLEPLVARLSRRTQWGRVVVVSVLYVAFAGALVGGGILLAPVIEAQFLEARRGLEGWLQGVQTFLNQGGEIHFLGITWRLGALGGELSSVVGQGIETLRSGAIPAVLGVVESLVRVVIYFIATFYFLLHGRRFVDGFRSLFVPPYRQEVDRLLAEVDWILGAYIRGQGILILIMSVLNTVGLLLLQVRYAVLLGILVSVLEVIPWVGPGLGALTVGLVGLTQDPVPYGWPRWLFVLAILGLFALFRQFQDHILIPQIVGSAVQLHPLLAIFALLAGGSLAGALGLLLAIPAAALLRSLFFYVHEKVTEPYAWTTPPPTPPPVQQPTEEAEEA